MVYRLPPSVNEERPTRALAPTQYANVPDGPTLDEDSGNAWDDILPEVDPTDDELFKINFSLALKEFRKSNDAFSRMIKRLDKFTPRQVPLTAQGVAPATGPLVLIFGCPDEGDFWEVKSAAIGGSEINVAAAGSAGLYTSPVPPLSGVAAAPGASLINLRDYASALPNVGFYGTGQFVIDDNEYLFNVIFSPTAGQQYAANVRVTILNDLLAADAGGNLELAVD